MPEPETFHSAGGQWRLTVTPRRLEGQLEYFSDKVAGRDNPGVAEGAKADGPRADLYTKAGGGRWQRVARWQLVNEVAPVSAIVANDGTVVTFDNWHAMGHGDDVVVIYRPDGSLVRKLGLADLLEEEDISQLSHSVSSISWSGTHRVDEGKRVLLLEIDAFQMETLPLSLDSGALLVPKRAMFPRPRVTWTAAEMATLDCDGGIAISATELAAHAVTADAPEYREVARKARVAGTVIVDISIAPSGVVERAKILKPLPFGLDRAAHDSVLKWRFRPVERDGKPVSVCGRVIFKYELAHRSR
ncbi:MAG TPA: energy transducer TonB [Thermoanaerobaculia bacterium]